jgi:predicted glycoside hydrolase/deacetylase ChbG (UPF0249 family)
MLGLISAEEVLHEYRLQFSYISEQGVKPTHFDGEKHSHLFLPQTIWALDRLIAESGINKLRLINESALTRTLKKQGIVLKGNINQRLKLAFLESRTSRSRTALKDCRSPDYSFGVLLSGRIAAAETKRVLEAILLQPEDSTVEWMFHPGYPFDEDEQVFASEFGRFFLTEARDRERTTLLSPEIREVLQKHQKQLISYRDL